MRSLAYTTSFGYLHQEKTALEHVDARLDGATKTFIGERSVADQ
jgi:hypothetical protein